jgi:ATP adenylyltransferase
MNRENLWAPWRMAYLHDLQRKQEAVGRVEAKDADFLAAYWRSPADDALNLVIFRDDQGMILLNRYPYANGHLLVALGEARMSLGEYAPAQRAHFWRLVDRATTLVERALNPQGVNIGVNQGAAAGAGLPQHIHAHVLPRWHGDTNFLAAIGNIRVIPDSLEAMAQLYRAAIASVV